MDKDITLPRICLWPTDRYGAMHIAHASRVKIVPLYFVHNFPKCISILKIISPTDYSSNYAVKSSWKIPPRFKRVTTIPRDLSLITISVSDCRQSADNNISQASVRSYALEMWRDLWLSLYSIQIFGRVRFKEFWKKKSVNIGEVTSKSVSGTCSQEYNEFQRTRYKCIVKFHDLLPSFCHANKTSLSRRRTDGY